MSAEDYDFEVYNEDFYVNEGYDARQQRRAKKMESIDKLKANRFYVGSDRVLQTKHRSGLGFSTWGHSEIEKAIAHAQKILEETPDQEFVFIVEIVKVVRRQKTPVIIEDL